MASPEVLDFAQLMAPIPGDNPAGANLRADGRPNSPFSQIREARNNASKSERRAEKWVSSTEEPSPPNPMPDWELIVTRGQEVLAKVSKDCQVAAWVIEALTRKYGFAGLRDGLRLARELTARYWDNLYPVPDPDEGGDPIEAKITPLGALNGGEKEGPLFYAIQRVPFTNGAAPRRVNRLDFIEAETINGITDADKKAQRIEENTVTLEIFEQTMRATTDLPVVAEDIRQCLKEVEDLGTLLDEKCKQAGQGSVAPPSLRNIRQALEDCQGTVEPFLPTPEEGKSSTAAGAQEADGSDDSAAGGMTRKKALKQLSQVAQYFKRAEPHSPLGYALERWAMLGERSLPQLLTEIGIIDEPTRKNLAMFVGISLPSADAPPPSN